MMGTAQLNLKLILISNCMGERCGHHDLWKGERRWPQKGSPKRVFERDHFEGNMGLDLGFLWQRPRVRSARYFSPSRGGLNGGSKISVYKVIIKSKIRQVPSSVEVTQELGWLITHSLAVINLTGLKNQNQFLMLGTGFLENLTLYNVYTFKRVYGIISYTTIYNPSRSTLFESSQTISQIGL